MSRVTRSFSNRELAAMMRAFLETFVTGYEDDREEVARELILDYLLEVLRRASSRRLGSFLLGRDLERILAELAEREDP